MLLISSKQVSFQFVELQHTGIGSLPESMQPAARLIKHWLCDAEEFTMHTSGSTGEPKNIRLEREKIIHSAKLTAEAFGLKMDDTLLCCLSTESIAGFMMVMRALVNECNLLITEPKSNPLAEINPKQRIDFAAFVPLQMESMLRDGFETIKMLNRMKAILLGGAPVNEALQEKLQIIQAPLFQTYGMTETYTHVAVRRLNGPFASGFYYPLKGVALSLDERGCLVIKSAVTDWKPLVTNDIAEFQPDGSFKWIGRWDNVINSGGIKIQLEKVEEAVLSYFKKENLDLKCFATGIPDARLGQVLILFIEGQNWTPEMENRLLEGLRSELGKYEIPKRTFYVAKFKETKSGKIDRIGTSRDALANSPDGK